jgi:hypothetical protein
VKFIQCRILVYSGHWDEDTSGFRRSWGKRLRTAVHEAVAGRGAIVGLAFMLTEPNSVGLAVTVEVLMGWCFDDPHSLVERLHEGLVVRLRPECERQIEVEIMDDPDAEEYRRLRHGGS